MASKTGGNGKSPAKEEERPQNLPPTKEAPAATATSREVGSKAGKRKAATPQRYGRNIRKKTNLPPPTSSAAPSPPPRVVAEESSSSSRRRAASQTLQSSQPSPRREMLQLGFLDPNLPHPLQPSPHPPLAPATSSTAQIDVEPMRPEGFIFPPEDYKKSLTVAAKCHQWHFQELFKNMGLKAVEKNWFLEHPQFKHIIHMISQRTRKLKAVHMLLLRTAKIDKKKQAWFVVNGVPIRYSIREHALLSGLFCHQYPADKEMLGDLSWAKSQFGKRKVDKNQIHAEDVLSHLKKMRYDGSQNRLKMLVLYFLATVLKERSKHNPVIESFILQVVDDLEACVTFPWGRFTFDDSIYQIKHVGDNFNGSMREGGSYIFPGFINPLEILAFECIPALDVEYRKPGEGDICDECPRMCKRQFKRTGTTGFSLDDIYTKLGDTNVITSVLVPTEEEARLLSKVLDEETLFDEELNDDNDVCDVIVDGWNKSLMCDNAKIWWEDLYKRDIEYRTCRVAEEEEQVALEGEEEAEGEGRGEPMQREERGGYKEQIKRMMELMMKPIEASLEAIKEQVRLMNQKLVSVENELHPTTFMDYEPPPCFDTGGTSSQDYDDDKEKFKRPCFLSSQEEARELSRLELKKKNNNKSGIFLSYSCMDSLLLPRRSFAHMNSQPSYGVVNTNEEKRVLEKSRSLLNWLTERNFDKIKDEIVQTITASPSASVIKSLVCYVFDMAMMDNSYGLFARLCVHLFHALPPFRSAESHGEVTTFEKLFLRNCRVELQGSSPQTHRPPLVYVEESNCWRFIKTVRVLAEIFKNRMLTQTSRQSIIQVLMDPIFPPERNANAMNLFLSSVGILADFQFCDENFKQLLQTSRAAEFESNYNEQVKLRKEAEDALARKKGALELMKRLLESYKEEKGKLLLHAQGLEQKYQEELELRRQTECALAIERESIAKVTLRLETLEDEHNKMRLRAEELESNYTGELILREETQVALRKERSELEAMTQLLQTCQIEQENLASQVTAWQDKYDQESSLRKETQDSLSHQKQELEIVKGLLQSYNQEADAMREERDSALQTVQELSRKNLEERQPPPSFFCPITQDVMKDPHFAADGFTYEAEAIRTWFSKGHDTSPMTNLKLPHRNLVPNRALRSAIQDLV